MTESNYSPKRSLGQLISDVPVLLTTLIRDEVESLKRELAKKAAFFGVGAGLFAAAGALVFFATALLIASATLGLATVLPAWLAALLVAVALLVIAGILVLVGIRSMKRGGQPLPPEVLESVRLDVNAVKGLGRQ
jgi:hypothetical protein